MLTLSFELGNVFVYTHRETKKFYVHLPKLRRRGNPDVKPRDPEKREHTREHTYCIGAYARIWPFAY